MKFDIFFSHNGKDKPAVRQLADMLRERSFSVWIDEDELPPGVPWQSLLESAIKSSNSVAVLVAKEGPGPWEEEEMQAALRAAGRIRTR